MKVVEKGKLSTEIEVVGPNPISTYQLYTVLSFQN